jgi:hypothetical protein
MRRFDQNIYHAILIDTEPKTLKNIIENKKRYPYIDNKNVLSFQHGRGNNWALGYMDSKIKQKSFLNQVIKIENEKLAQE